MTSKSAAVLGHLALAVATAVLMAAGFVLLTTRADAFTTLAAAVSGPNLEISGAGTSAWGASAWPAWTLTNGAPGDTATGIVRLRTLEAPPAGTVLVLRAQAPEATPGFADHLFVSSMSLGGVDLLPRWSDCAGGATLTLQHLATCPELSAQLPVPSTAGVDFIMAVQLDPDMGNAFQGASTGGVTFEFSLWSPDGPGEGGPDGGAEGTPTPVTGGGTAATATATASVAPSTPTSNATPQPPRTGFGWVPDEQRQTVGYGLIGLGALLAALLLASLVAMTRRRPR